MSVVGDVREVPFEGMIVLRILACCFASFFVSSICFVRSFRLACSIVLLSLFLYFACLCLFSCVGSFISFSCSACCFCICRLCLGSHHLFRRGLGALSWCSIVSFSACWMLVKCCEVVRGWGWFFVFVILVLASAIWCLCVWYTC